MPKLINCECGQVVRGNTDDELLASAIAHVNQDHPELVGKLSREDILAMAEEAPPGGQRAGEPTRSAS